MSGEKLDCKTVILERLQVTQRKIITGDLLQNIPAVRDTLETFSEDVMHGLALSVRAYVLAKRNEEVLELEWVPISWWDHFKRTYFPEWLKEYFPVRLRKITKSAIIYKACPHAEIPWPEDKWVHINYLTRPE